MTLQEHTARVLKKQAELEKETKKFIKSLESFNKSNEYSKGYISCQKKYEEKLRWIPITEKLPPLNKYVLFKYSEGEYCVGCLNDYGYYCSPYIPAEEDFASIHLLSEVTHWRSFL